MIGAGGVATVAAFKIAQNADVFTEFMIASRRKVKCDQIVEAIERKFKEQGARSKRMVSRPLPLAHCPSLRPRRSMPTTWSS